MKFQNIKDILLNLNKKGLFHIILSSSLSKAISFVSAIFLPRFLTKSDYGLLSYVDNINNYLMLINGIGVVNATIRYCSLNESEEKKKGYFLTTIIVGICFDVIMLVSSVAYFISVPLAFEGANKYLILLSLMPVLTFLFEDIQLLLRAVFENKRFSFLSFFYSFMMVLLQVLFAYLYGINGVVIGRYLSIIASLFIGFNLIRSISVYKGKALLPSKETIKSMIKFSIVMMVTNATSLVMTLNETFILGNVLKSETALAEYKVASYILVISLFLTQSIMVFVFPYFVKHIDDKEWIWKNFKKLFIINAFIMIPFHLLLILFAEWIVLILFGSSYLVAVPVMRMLLIASLSQSLLRGIVGNILGGIGEEKYNLKINIVLVVIHLIIDYYAVLNFGINGSATALIIVYTLSGVLMTCHLKKVCHNSINKKRGSLL